MKLTLRDVGKIDINSLFVGIVEDAPSILYCRQQDQKWFLLRDKERPEKVDRTSISQLRPFEDCMIKILYRPNVDEYQIWFDMLYLQESSKESKKIRLIGVSFFVIRDKKITKIKC